MDAYRKVPDKGDPSDVLQIFPGYNVQLLCCRYWWLRNWEFKELSFPYWRIYHNNWQGAFIEYLGREYELTPDKMVMIAPNTPYSTRLYDHEIPETGYAITGGRVEPGLTEDQLRDEGCILHLFIHFNIGMPYDNISPGIFTFELTEHLKQKLILIKRYLNYEHLRFNFHSGLTIQSLISDLLAELPEKSWDLITGDHRILKVLNYVEKNTGKELNNIVLAQVTGMATNAFTRLFTREVGMPPQTYVKKKRIDKACISLHHSGLSIDEVAAQTGFADRYHFSRIFKQVSGVSPARYKKEFGMKS